MKPQSHDISQPPRSNWWFVCLVLGVAFTAIGLWVWPSIQNGSDDWGYSIRDADWTNAERASLKLRLGQEQSALARYEAEHREWVHRYDRENEEASVACWMMQRTWPRENGQIAVTSSARNAG
jgi:hypothetical protein